MKLPITLAAALICLPFGSPAEAAGVTEIKIDHTNGRIFEAEDAREVTPIGYPIASLPNLEARKGNTVFVSVVGVNRLLFTYQLEKGTPVTTENQKVLETLATGLNALGNLLKSRTAAAETEAAALTEEAPVATPTPPCSQRLGNLAETITEIANKSDRRPEIVRISLDHPNDAKSEVDTWELDDLQSDLTKEIKDLQESAEQIVSNDPDDPCAGVVALAIDIAASAQRVLDELKAFGKAVRELDTPIELTFTQSPTENQPIKLSVAKSDIFPKTLATTRFVGNTSFTVAPRSRIDILSLNAAGVYSFARDPSFEAVATGDHFTIKKTEEPYKKFELAAMIGVEPRSWDLGALNLGIQFGVAAEDRIGLLLGLSARAGSMFTFGAGIAYQQVDRLKPGLSEGQSIASKDVLKTEDDFNQGLYLSVSVSLPSKN